MGAKVTNVSATNAILLERPALAAFTEALPDAAKIADFAAVSAGAVLEIPSQRPVLTPSFEPRAEAALNTTLREVAAGLPGARGGVVAIGEFRGPWGVPDLVALAPSRVGQRLSCAVPPLLSQHDCRLVAAAGRWMEPAALAAAAKVSQNAAERYIRRLTSIGALEIRRGRLKRAAGMVPSADNGRSRQRLMTGGLACLKFTDTGCGLMAPFLSSAARECRPRRLPNRHGCTGSAS